MATKINAVYKTDNYDMFRTLDSNRAVDSRRVAKVKRSIAAVGQLNPIVCNEKNEVVDEQARLAACRALGVPVQYIIVKGADIDLCRSANATNKAWTSNDYIRKATATVETRLIRT